MYSPDDAFIARNIFSLFLLCFLVKRDQVFPVIELPTMFHQCVIENS
jgi:hypothetical protein